MIKQILWDWNGTLLNDVQYCISVRNRVMPPLGFAGVNSIEQYRDEFTFPISDYYARAGITEKDFVRVADLWMDEYNRCFSEVPLYEDAEEVLNTFHHAGIRQSILSATRLDMLKEQVEAFPIRQYFDSLLGLGDIYGKSKETLGLEYIASCGIEPDETVMIGDTLHDAHVAAAMGTKCILVCRGHHSRERLMAAGVAVFDTLAEAASVILSL